MIYNYFKIFHEQQNIKINFKVAFVSLKLYVFIVSRMCSQSKSAIDLPRNITKKENIAKYSCWTLGTKQLLKYLHTNHSQMDNSSTAKSPARHLSKIVQNGSNLSTLSFKNCLSYTTETSTSFVCLVSIVFTSLLRALSPTFVNTGKGSNQGRDQPCTCAEWCRSCYPPCDSRRRCSNSRIEWIQKKRLVWDPFCCTQYWYRTMYQWC